MTRELSCDEAQALYFDRTSEVELDEATNQALDRHLEGCEACQRFVEEVAKMDEGLAGVIRDSPDLNDPEETEADVARVLSAIKAYEAGREDADPGRSARQERGSPWGKLLLAAVVLVAVGLGIGRGLVPSPYEGTVIAGPPMEDLQTSLNKERAMRKQLERQLEQERAQHEQDAREFEARIAELERRLEAAKKD